MAIIVNMEKAYVGSFVVNTAGGKLEINGEVIKANLTDKERADVMHAVEYNGVVYINTDDD